jgi:hypothetical protein
MDELTNGGGSDVQQKEVVRGEGETEGEISRE